MQSSGYGAPTFSCPSHCYHHQGPKLSFYHPHCLACLRPPDRPCLYPLELEEKEAERLTRTLATAVVGFISSGRRSRRRNDLPCRSHYRNRLCFDVGCGSTGALGIGRGVAGVVVGECMEQACARLQCEESDGRVLPKHTSSHIRVCDSTSVVRMRRTNLHLWWLEGEGLSILE